MRALIELGHVCAVTPSARRRALHRGYTLTELQGRYGRTAGSSGSYLSAPRLRTAVVHVAAAGGRAILALWQPSERKAGVVVVTSGARAEVWPPRRVLLGRARAAPRRVGAHRAPRAPALVPRRAAQPPPPAERVRARLAQLPVCVEEGLAGEALEVWVEGAGSLEAGMRTLARKLAAAAQSAGGPMICLAQVCAPRGAARAAARPCRAPRARGRRASGLCALTD